MRCPICKTTVPDSEEDRPSTFPFCSERCKLIDLGRWLDGRYQIPVAATDEDEPPATAADSTAPRDDDDGNGLSN